MQDILGTKKGSRIYEIRLLICVAQADGYIDEVEKEWIFRHVQQELFSVRERQIFHDDIENPKDCRLLAEGISSLLNWNEKMMLIRKLFKLACSDKKISIEEKEVIYQIASILEIEEEKTKQVENWIVDGMKWLERWEEILAESLPK